MQVCSSLKYRIACWSVLGFMAILTRPNHPIFSLVSQVYYCPCKLVGGRGYRSLIPLGGGSRTHSSVKKAILTGDGTSTACPVAVSPPVRINLENNYIVRELVLRQQELAARIDRKVPQLLPAGGHAADWRERS